GEGDDVALDVEVAEEVGLTQRHLAEGPEHSTKGARVLQDQRERRGARTRLPGVSVPQSDGEVAGIVLRQRREELQGRRTGWIRGHLPVLQVDRFLRRL